MDDFFLHVIGSGSALSMHGRHPSAQVVQYGALHALIDCGEGTQDRLRAAGIKPFKIDLILISHLHGDHLFGLPGLLGSFSHLNRTSALTIHGPVGLKAFLESIISLTSLKITYPLHIFEHHPASLISIWKNDDLEVLTFPLNHRVPCNGYLIRELKSRINLRKDLVEGYSLSPEQIKAIYQKQDILIEGRKFPASDFILPAEPLLSYAYCSDTRYDESILPWIRNVSVLYHETTYMEDKKELAEITGHSTSFQTATIALKAHVGCLMTGHYSSRYKDLSPLLDEVQSQFKHAILSEEGKKYSLRSLVNADKY